MRNLDVLSQNADTLSTEDLIIIRELYKNGGHTEKAAVYNAKVVERVKADPVQPTIFSKAVRKGNIQ